MVGLLWRIVRKHCSRRLDDAWFLSEGWPKPRVIRKIHPKGDNASGQSHFIRGLWLKIKQRRILNERGILTGR